MSPRALRLGFPIAIVVMAAVAACGGSNRSPAAVMTPEPVATTRSAAVTGTPPTLEPTAATGPAALCAVDGDLCAIEAGTYTTAPFEPAFTFTIASTWGNTRAYADGGGIDPTQTRGAIFWISGTAHAVVEPMEWRIEDERDFARYIKLLKAERGYEVGATTAASIGGVDGLQVDVTRRAGVSSTDAGFFLAEDVYYYEPGGQSRVYFIETPGMWTFFVVEGDAERFESIMEVAQPVLESIVWE